MATKTNLSLHHSNKIKLELLDSNRSRMDIKTPTAFIIPDYNNLSNLPSINGVVLKGSMSYVDLFLAKESVNTKEYWEENIHYVPEPGEIIIYTNRRTINNVDYVGIKIGDGNSYVVDLPFLGDDSTLMLYDLIQAHKENNVAHITQSERAFWNNKINCDIEGEVLVFNRN